MHAVGHRFESVHLQIAWGLNPTLKKGSFKTVKPNLKEFRFNNFVERTKKRVPKNML